MGGKIPYVYQPLLRGASFKFPPLLHIILQWKGGGNLKLAPRSYNQNNP